jgi:hypothetical protein
VQYNEGKQRKHDLIYIPRGTPIAVLRLVEEVRMDTLQHHRALLGICRQRAQMEGEDASFWLEEAAIRERLIVLAERMQTLGIEEVRPGNQKH